MYPNGDVGLAEEAHERSLLLPLVPVDVPVPVAKARATTVFAAAEVVRRIQRFAPPPGPTLPADVRTKGPKDSALECNKRAAIAVPENLIASVPALSLFL